MLSESRFLKMQFFKLQVDTVGVQKCLLMNKNTVGLYDDYRGIPIYGSSYCARDLGIVLLAEMDEEEVEPIGVLRQNYSYWDSHYH